MSPYGLPWADREPRPDPNVPVYLTPAEVAELLADDQP